MALKMMCIRLLSNRPHCPFQPYIQSLRSGLQGFYHKQGTCFQYKTNSSNSPAVLNGVSDISALQLPARYVSLKPWRTPGFSGRTLPPGGYAGLCSVKVTFSIYINLRPFHTSEPRGALPGPLVWLVLKPLQKLLAIILGRSIRKWWVALPPNRRQLLRQAAWRRRWHLAAGGTGLLVVFALFCLTHLDESPVTGRTRLLVLSQEKFMELADLTSDLYMKEFEESLISPEDPRHKVVEMVLKHLVQRNHDIVEMTTMPWSVHVVDNGALNAFVLPNGKVVVFTGMLEAIDNIHELTVVLGHEVAHAVIGHAAEQASLSHVVDVLSLILLTAIWAICPRDSLAILGQWVQGKLVQFMLERPYSRKLEAEADQVGMQLAAKACADVRAGPVFWRRMELLDQLGDEAATPEWLSTHPSHKNRIRLLDRLVPEALELRQKCDCPVLPCIDPRAVFSTTMQKMLDRAEQRKQDDAAGQAPSLPCSPEPSPPGTAPLLGGLLEGYIKNNLVSSNLESRLGPSPGPSVTVTD